MGHTLWSSAVSNILTLAVLLFCVHNYIGFFSFGSQSFNVLRYDLSFNVLNLRRNHKIFHEQLLRGQGALSGQIEVVTNIQCLNTIILGKIGVLC